MANTDHSKDPSDLTPVAEEPNPYAPPKGETPDLVSYLQPLARQKAAIALIGVEGIVAILAFFTAYTSGLKPPTELWSVDVLRMTVSTAGFVVFLTWFFRMYKNLYILGREHMRCTPGWAVGYWFIPFLNLVRPVQCVYDIWRTGALDGEPPTGNPLFGWWWSAWLGSAILGLVASSPGQQSVVIASYCLDLLVIGLTMVVIHTLGVRQERKARSLGLITGRSKRDL